MSHENPKFPSSYSSRDALFQDSMRTEPTANAHDRDREFTLAQITLESLVLRDSDIGEDEGVVLVPVRVRIHDLAHDDRAVSRDELVEALADQRRRSDRGNDARSNRGQGQDDWRVWRNKPSR
jgi:hypothetical protein